MTAKGCGSAQDQGPENGCGSTLPCCCGGATGRTGPSVHIAAPWINGVIETASGEVPRVRTVLKPRDHSGAIKARWGLGRMRYSVPPGLYAVGTPGSDSPVMVSANYKLSFDHLRRALDGRDAWILVLDTRGINVWCAAGKGTFGTDEIVRRIADCGLAAIVSHRKLIVPQLGATGVSAHLVRQRCGFRVIYGPVRARDLPAFLDAGLRASDEMRRVRFGLRDRTALIPVELVVGARYFLFAAAVLVLLGGLGRGGYSLAGVRMVGLPGAAMVIGAFAVSAILGPALLPWLPGRPFSVKGAVLGFLLFVVLVACFWSRSPGYVSWPHAAAWALLIPAIASFTVMNFTGATTFTSLSGVLREMRIAVPAQIAGGLIGLGLWVAGLFLAAGR